MIVQCKEEDVEKNGYPQTHRQTDRLKCNTLTQTSPRTGLGKNEYLEDQNEENEYWSNQNEENEYFEIFSVNQNVLRITMKRMKF